MKRTMCLPLAALMALALAPASAVAQRQRKPAAPPEPVLSFAEMRDWTLHFEVEARSGADSYYYPVRGGAPAVTPTPTYRLDSAEVFFPYPESSATHESAPANFNFKAEVRWESNIIDDQPALTPGPLGSGRYLRLLLPPNLGPYVGDQLRLSVSLPMTCRETRLDEPRAFRIGWPTKPWPSDLEPCLQAERFIDSDAAEIRDLVREWTNNAPRSMPPARLAKHLCGKVVELLQPTSNGLATNTLGQTQGFLVSGAAYAARQPRPTQEAPDAPNEYDMTCLLAAVYRAAGIPSRIVIALDPVKSDQSRTPVFRSWVEFALLDESAPAPPNWPAATPWPGRLEWIPVDVARQREFSSRAPPIAQRWQYFGHNEDTDDLLPIAFQFHPPALALPPPPPTPVDSRGRPKRTSSAGAAVVAYGSVGLWGWRPQPGIPPIDQTIRGWGAHTVRRGDER